MKTAVLLKKIWLALYHFRWTILFIILGGMVCVYFKLDTLGSFIVAAFLGWLQAFIDKVKEIGRQLELEQSRQKILQREDLVSMSLDELPHAAQSRITDVPKWREIFLGAQKPFIGLVAVLILLMIFTLFYLYLYF